MTDIEITRDKSGEFMVAQIEGISDEGISFVDAFCVGDPLTDAMYVVDAGRIVIAEADIETLVKEASDKGLTVAEVA